jgi:hypothetical protein
MSGLVKSEEGKVKIVHYSSSSLIKMVVKSDEPLEDGTTEEKESEIWFDYSSFGDLKKLVNKIGDLL